MSDVVTTSFRIAVDSGLDGLSPLGFVERLAGDYYKAYREYAAAYARGVDVGRVDGSSVAGVEDVRRGIEPPVWVGLRGLPHGDSGDVDAGSVCDGVAGVAGLRVGGAGATEQGQLGPVACESVGSAGLSCGSARTVDTGVCTRDGDVGEEGLRVLGSVVGGQQTGSVDGDVLGCKVASVGVQVGDQGVRIRGKNYEKNKERRERAKKLRSSVSGLKEVCPSLSGSVCTVDTRTAEEIEAARTLAARRIVENKVAGRMAELKLISLNNKDKTDAVLRLEAARMEQRINEAKARSQASFKKCDTSLKSLGSTGSAGEFALKQEVKRGKDWEIKCKYAQLQNDYMIKHVPEHVRQVILDMPEPVLEHDAEVFGECPEDYDDEQRMAYDIEMNSRAAGVQY